MAYELLNNGPATPHRIHALVRLVRRLQPVSRQMLLDLLQPRALTENQSTASDVLKAAIECGLVAEVADHTLSLTSAGAEIHDVDDFRAYMRQLLTGVTSPTVNNHLLNQFTAWYAVQNERVFQMPQSEYPVRFNTELYPGAEPRPFNDTKLIGWRIWATFVGWGWLFPQGQRSSLLVPDAQSRLKDVLDLLLPSESPSVPLSTFVARLADKCPELDGGLLFEHAWKVSRGGQQRGSNLSLMLSTGLRALHDENIITLIAQPDAEQTWYLFPAQGHIGQSITHICRGGASADTAI